MTDYVDHEVDEVEAEGAAALKPLAQWQDAPRREALLWRDRDPKSDEADRQDAVLRVGDVAILSAPGGTGKSYLSLAWAAAAQKPEDGENWGRACGMRIRTGPAVMVSYEDEPDDMAARVQLLQGGRDALQTIYAWDDPAPLWHHETGKDEQWAGLWAKVKYIRARLIVIDPASVALDGPANDVGPVRAFLAALRSEAKQANCGVMLITHDTKTARNQAKQASEGFDPGAGAVAGSAAWFDAARCVLYLAWDPITQGKTQGKRLLQVIKANHGQTGWGVALKERWTPDGQYGGLTQDGLTLGADQVKDVQADWRETLREASKPNKRKGEQDGETEAQETPWPA